MIKLLIIIYNNEKKLKTIFKKYKLTFNATTYGMGTASNSLLMYLGLDEVRKNIYFSLIRSHQEKMILNDLKDKLKLKEIGQGVALTISLTSSSKFLSDTLRSKGELEMENSDYELIVTIVKEGYSDLVMQAAKKAGCNGGTVIEGRSLGTDRTIFMNISIEPEKDIVLNIVKNDIKRQVMESITKMAGIKTDARGLLISLKVDNVIGLQDEE